MIELLRIEYLNKPLLLVGSMAGWQQVFWGSQAVSQIAASEKNEGDFHHEFWVDTQTQELVSPPSPDMALAPSQTIMQGDVKKIELDVHLTWDPFLVNYTLSTANQTIERGTRTTEDIERQQRVIQQEEPKASSVGLIGLVFKLLKSAKAIKAILAVATLATYSWLFSFKFAVAFVACLVIHECGHVWAMKRCGIPTRGFYLIPFFGGIALTDGKINTRWQDVFISMMGPIFGLGLSVLLWLAYIATDHIFIGALANFNAFLNLINLLPILPLDGGHVAKSICFSSKHPLALVVMGVLSAVGIAAYFMLGLSFLGFFMILGILDIVFEWRARHMTHLLPLDKRGQIISGIWYLTMMLGLIGIMVYFANTGDPLLAAPMAILKT